MSDPSILSPSDDAIRYDLYRRSKLAKILVALSEEPCYIFELSGRLLISRETVGSSILYLENAGLIYGVSNRTDNQLLTNMIRAKRQRFKQRLSPKLAEHLVKRVEFYFITERGKEFLEHAKRSLYGDS